MSTHSVQVIAHRGSSGYLPEHTLAAKAMAHAQGADYLEQDVVLTRDAVPIVLHDVHLDTVTDVATVFPDRARDDGRFYAIDFDWSEIQQLSVCERFDPRTGAAVFPGRFAAKLAVFKVPSLAEELQFIQALNRSTGREAGIYPEIKQPAFHRAHGHDLTANVLNLLGDFGYRQSVDPCLLQCFDETELRRVRRQFHSQLRTVQLLEQVSWLEDRSELAGRMAEIRTYADGIGPPVVAALNLKAEAASGFPVVEAAHAAGLFVHPWTYRADALPPRVQSFVELHRLTQQAGIDGIFSDFPDQSRQLLG